MTLSALPVLVLIIFGFLWFLVKRLFRQRKINAEERNWLAIVLITLLVWGGYVAYESNRGGFNSADFLASMPGYWLPFVPVVIVTVLLVLSPPLRRALRTLADETPMYWLSGIHILRILAIGSLLKASMGEFPARFAWFVGGPDLLFGLSAIMVTILLHKRGLGELSLIGWNLVGALVILAPVLGLMHLFEQEVLFRELFAFPMVLAPGLVVPTLVMMNLLVAGRLLEKRLIVS